MITDKLAKIRLEVMTMKERTFSCMHDNNIFYRADCPDCIIEAEFAYIKKIAHTKHIENVNATCKRLGCTVGELNKMDYMKILKYE